MIFLGIKYEPLSPLPPPSLNLWVVGGSPGRAIQAQPKVTGSYVVYKKMCTFKLNALNENKFIHFNLCWQSCFISSSFCFERVCQEIVKCRATKKISVSTFNCSLQSVSQQMPWYDANVNCKFIWLVKLFWQVLMVNIILNKLVTYRSTGFVSLHKRHCDLLSCCTDQLQRNINYVWTREIEMYTVSVNLKTVIQALCLKCAFIAHAIWQLTVLCGQSLINWCLGPRGVPWEVKIRT